MTFTASEPPIVEVENASVRRGDQWVLRDITFHITKGDFVALVGPNGAGKSTLLQTLVGILPASSGSVRLFGQSLVEFQSWYRVGYLPQFGTSGELALPLTVREIVHMGLLPLRRRRGSDVLDRERAVLEALSNVGLAELAEVPFERLSVGQKHRALLARALVAQPDLLLLDEPLAALDPAFRAKFFDLMHSLQKERGITILLVTHDSASVGEYAKRLMYLDRKVIFFGTFREFCESPDMTTYFGRYQQHQICHQHDKL